MPLNEHLTPFTTGSRIQPLLPEQRDELPSTALSAYRLALPYERPPVQRRVSGFVLAVGINIGLLMVLMTLGYIPPPSGKALRGIVVDLLPRQQSSAPTTSRKTQSKQTRVESDRPLPKPPPIILPVKPTITPTPQQVTKPAPWLEMSHDEMAASDISKLRAEGSGSAGDSQVVGQGPNGEALYAAEWAREPTDAELSGYLPRNSKDGYGLVACKTIPGNRVDDCIELAQSPPGSHLASAVRQAAWQFRVRPPRKGGHLLVGSWVRIRIDYSRAESD